MSLGFSSEQNSDYKYQMADLSTLYFGAKYSYAELLADSNTNIKVKKIIAGHLVTDREADTTLESEMYYLTAEDPSYEIFDLLKTRIRVMEPRVHRTLFGREETLYKEKLLTLKELVQIPAEEKKRLGLVICEIQISKLGLMTFTI